LTNFGLEWTAPTLCEAVRLSQDRASLIRTLSELTVANQKKAQKKNYTGIILNSLRAFSSNTSADIIIGLNNF